jgi:hypothetical protein
MLTRCTNAKHSSYPQYGARGIHVCDHWRHEHGFETFLRDMGERHLGTSINRIDNDAGYLCPTCCPPYGNCNWATRKQQAHNRRRMPPERQREVARIGARNQPREAKILGGQVSQMKIKLKRAIAALEAP